MGLGREKKEMETLLGSINPEDSLEHSLSDALRRPRAHSRKRY